MVFEAPGGSAPAAAERLARMRPGKADASGALTPQTSPAGEGSGELPAARGGRGHVVGSCREVPPESVQALLSVPRAEAPSPKRAGIGGGGRSGRVGGGGREGRGEGASTMGAGRGWRGGGPEAEPRGAAGAAREGEEEKAEEGNPSCPQHPSVSCYQPKGAASGRGDRSR